MPPLPPSPQAFEDASHLKALAIGHYVSAALTAFFSCFALIYIALGGAMALGKIPTGPAPVSGTSARPETDIMGWFFIVFGLVFLIIGLTTAICQFLAGRWLVARKNRMFCLIVSGVECLNVPIGTALGVFTILVLCRPSVKALFDAGPEANNFSHQ